MLFSHVYWVDGEPEIVQRSPEPAELLDDALRSPWEEGTGPGAGCLIVREDGLLYAAVTVREVLGECDGVLEVYRPAAAPYRVRARYISGADGTYDHTEVTPLDRGNERSA